MPNPAINGMKTHTKSRRTLFPKQKKTVFFELLIGKCTSKTFIIQSLHFIRFQHAKKQHSRYFVAIEKLFSKMRVPSDITLQ